MLFPYKKTEDSIYRPLVPAKLSNGAKSIKYEMLINSGSDICIADLEVANQLGLDLSSMAQNTVQGFGGSHVIRFSPVTVELGTHKTKILLAFTNLRGAPYGILGHGGFLELFSVCLSYRKLSIAIT